jgi:RsiW-degrading membrane proteinase PrsW (M82 family)
MPIPIACSCGKSLKVKDEYAGKRVKCPGCGQPLSVPAKSEETHSLPIDTGSDTPPAPPPDEPAPNVAGWGSLDEEPAPDVAGWGSLGDEPPRPTQPRKSRRGSKTRPRPAAETSSAREYLYWALALALIPLIVSLLSTQDDDVKQRLLRTIGRIEDAPAEVRARFEKAMEDEDISLSKLLDALPEGKIEGAHLAHNTWVHWIYAGLAGGVFLGLALFMFSPGHAEAHQLILVCLFTATIGIFLLLGVQFAASVTQGVTVHGRGILVPIFYLLKFIGYSYRSAIDPDNSFWLSLLGFTFGVGLCEEVCKALPLLAHFRRRPFLGWRGACLWGLASGIGFGVAEGITYSSDFYNGVHTAGIYVVRFVSCVALHGMWSAAAGIAIFEWRDYFTGEADWAGIAEAADGAAGLTFLSFAGQLALARYLLLLCRVLWMPILLHGLYDTLLKKEMNGAALIVALASFAWLVWKIEHARAVFDKVTGKRLKQAR